MSASATQGRHNNKCSASADTQKDIFFWNGEGWHFGFGTQIEKYQPTYNKLECRPMPNMMAALRNVDGALCSTPQSLAHADYWSAVH